jgi:hypothetical protein
LLWTCREDGLNVVFLRNQYLLTSSSGASIKVEQRFPGQPMTEMLWETATNHRAAFVPTKQIKPFTAAALEQPSIVLRVTDKDGDRVTVTFKLDGLADALKQLSCAK